jgi:hypothetical protein
VWPAPAFSPDDIVVIDDLDSHKSPEIRKAAARQIRTAAEGEFLPDGGKSDPTTEA